MIARPNPLTGFVDIQAVHWQWAINNITALANNQHASASRCEPQSCGCSALDDMQRLPDVSFLSCEPQLPKTSGTPIRNPIQIERHMMKQVKLTVPEIGLIAGTRAAAGAGLALLLCNRLNPDQRRAVGWTLLAVGIATTMPLVAQVFGKHCAPADREET